MTTKTSARMGLASAVMTGILALLAACGSGTADKPQAAMDPNAWQEDQPKLVMAMSLPPDLAAMSDGIENLRKGLEDRLGIPVDLRKVSGYDGMIQAMAADQIDLGTFGAGAIASLYDLIGDKVLPIASFRDYSGEMGYYSVLLVRSDSPYHSLADLKGKRIGYVDFNSTSGYMFPRYALNQQGIDPDTYFGPSGTTGGHLQSIIALSSGQYDAVFTLASTDDPAKVYTTGIMNAIAAQGIIDPEDYRFIWFAGPIPESAFVMRGDKNPGLTDAVRGVLTALPYEAPGLMTAYGQARGAGMGSVNIDFFQDIIRIRAAEISGDAIAPATEQGEEAQQ